MTRRKHGCEKRDNACARECGRQRVHCTAFMTKAAACEFTDDDKGRAKTQRANDPRERCQQPLLYPVLHHEYPRERERDRRNTKKPIFFQPVETIGKHIPTKHKRRRRRCILALSCICISCCRIGIEPVLGGHPSFFNILFSSLHCAHAMLRIMRLEPLQAIRKPANFARQ